MARARKRGSGAYTWEWRPTSEAPLATIDSVVELVVHWCKETLSATRRPWGIDHFDLVIGVRRDGGESGCLSLKNLAPGELYGHETLIRTLRRFLEANPEGHIAHVSIALFSWGDAAYAAMNTEPATASTAMSVRH